MTPGAPPQLLVELAALGPYFALDVHEPDAPLRGPWRGLTELFSSPGPLAARIGQVRDGLARAAGAPAGGVEFRVAASVAQLGLCARLMSPVLGATVLEGSLRIEVAQARWVPSLGGPFRLSVPGTAVRERRGGGAGNAAWRALLDGPISQLARAVGSMGVSPQVLWGNVASAVNGAAAMIAVARPDLAGTGEDVAATVLQYPALTGSYTGAPGPSFRRRNCCLIYRLSPDASYCGDCVLASPS